MCFYIPFYEKLDAQEKTEFDFICMAAKTALEECYYRGYYYFERQFHDFLSKMRKKYIEN